MKVILKSVFAVFISVVTVLSLTSCSVIDDFQRLGLRGWLNTGLKTDKSETPVTSSEPSFPFGTPSTKDTVAPDTSQLLPVMPEIPDMETIISEIDLTLPDRKSFIMYISSTPNVYALYGDTVETQNSLINEKFALGVSAHNDNIEIIDELLKSGEYFTDLLYIPLSSAVEYAQIGLLLPFAGSEYEQGNSVKYSINNNNYSEYFVVPSFSVPYESNIVIYCNTDLLKGLGVSEHIAEIASDGKFDADIFCRLINSVNLPENCYNIVSSFSSEKISRIFLSSADYSNSGLAETLLSHLDISDDQAAEKEFYNGNALFLIADVSNLRKFSDSYDSYAILPLPKADINDEAYPTVFNSDSLYVYAIPKSSQNSAAAMSYVVIRSIASKYQFRYEFAESLYSFYLRQSLSVKHLGTSVFSGKCDLLPVFADSGQLIE